MYICTATKNGKRYVFAAADNYGGALAAHVDHIRARGGHKTYHDAIALDEHMTLSLYPIKRSENDVTEPAPWGCRTLFIDQTVEPADEYIFFSTSDIRSLVNDGAVEDPAALVLGPSNPRRITETSTAELSATL